MMYLIYGVIFSSGAIVGHATYPVLFTDLKAFVRRRAEQAAAQLDEVFVKLPLRKLEWLYLGLPVGLGAFTWLLTGQWYFGLIGVGLGLLVPQFILKRLRLLRQAKFHGQLVESLLLMSSSLRAGLSLMQSFGIMAEEMGAPAKQEFALVIREMRMGVSLGDAVQHLKQRMPSDDMILFATTIMVVRETGGNVTNILQRLVETLRERKKIRERIKTLTFMAKMQGAVMAGLPIFFTLGISKLDPEHMKFFLNDPDGQMLLAAVVTIQLMGMYLFMRFSRSPL